MNFSVYTGAGILPITKRSHNKRVHKGEQQHTETHTAVRGGALDFSATGLLSNAFHEIN